MSISLESQLSAHTILMPFSSQPQANLNQANLKSTSSQDLLKATSSQPQAILKPETSSSSTPHHLHLNVKMEQAMPCEY